MEIFNLLSDRKHVTGADKAQERRNSDAATTGSLGSNASTAPKMRSRFYSGTQSLAHGTTDDIEVGLDSDTLSRLVRFWQPPCPGAVVPNSMRVPGSLGGSQREPRREHLGMRRGRANATSHPGSEKIMVD